MKSFSTLLSKGVRLRPTNTTQDYKEITDTYTAFSQIIADKEAQQMLDQHFRLVSALDRFLTP